jgi:hypothetical protein
VQESSFGNVIGEWEAAISSESNAMRSLRFHIGTVVIVVLVLGISFAALRESNELWDSRVFTLTVGVLSTSVLLAVHLVTNKRRAFWQGFALFGGVYLGLSLIPPIEARLIPTEALAYIDPKLPKSMPVGAGLAFADFDIDGRVGLYVANNSQPGALYVNKGNRTFQDVTATVGLDYTGNCTLDDNNSAGLGRYSTENDHHANLVCSSALIPPGSG